MARRIELPLINPGLSDGPVLFNADEYEENPKRRRRGRRSKRNPWKGHSRAHSLARKRGWAKTKRARAAAARKAKATRRRNARKGTRKSGRKAKRGTRRRGKKSRRRGRKAESNPLVAESNGGPGSGRKKGSKNRRRRKSGRKARKAKRAAVAAPAAKPRKRRRKGRKAGRKAGRRKGRKKGRKARRRFKGGKGPFAMLRVRRSKRRGYVPMTTPKGTRLYRHATKSKYEANPRRRRKARRSRRRAARRYARNPSFISGFGFVKPRSFASGWGAAKRQGIVKSALLGLGGLAAYGGIRMAMNQYVMPRMPAVIANNEMISDITRIAGTTALATGVSYIVGRVMKDDQAARTVQTGVWAGLLLDVAGTAIKYITRKTDGLSLTAGPVRAPLTPRQIGLNLLGMGAISDAFYQHKLASTLKTANIVVAGSDNGQVALVHGTTGEILMSGPAKQVQPVITALNGAAVSDKKSGYGEDITVES